MSSDYQHLYGLFRRNTREQSSTVDDILTHAKECKGLTLEEAATLLVTPLEYGKAIIDAAAIVKHATKGRLVTFYGVVYIHDYCVNSCPYCGDSLTSKHAARKLLSPEEFLADLSALCSKHDFKEICFLAGEDTKHFPANDLAHYLLLARQVYQQKININVAPMSTDDFKLIRKKVPGRLHFRVFQETYDRDIYAREHTRGPKRDFDWRIESQMRALDAGFDEIGQGVLYGLNDKEYGSEFETLAMLAYAQDIKAKYGRYPQSMSFPRLRQAEGVESYHVPKPITEDQLKRFVAVTKLTIPEVDTVITCRETAKFRREIRPIVNIEDFGAKPGPGGNSFESVHFQMSLPDSRSGSEVRDEMVKEGYEVQ
jgi:2-iminoacetate synthase